MTYGHVAAATGAALPFTGAALGLWPAAALALIAAGSAVLHLARRAKVTI